MAAILCIGTACLLASHWHRGNRGSFMVQRSLQALGALLGEMVYTLVWMPLVALPQRVWRHALGPAPRLRQWTRTLVPHGLLLVVVALIRYVQAVQVRPSLLPTFLGPQRAAHLAVWLQNVGWGLAQQAEWATNYTGSMLMGLQEVAPLVAALLAGTGAWLFSVAASTLFLGPLYLVYFDSRSRRILQMPLRPVQEWVQKAHIHMSRRWARQQGRWLVGVSGPMNAVPSTAPLDKSVWVMGGADRRGNAAPLVTLLRAHALAEHPMVVVDTLASVALSEDVQRCAREAGRSDDFKAVSGAVPAGYFAQAHARNSIVYVGLSLQNRDATQDEAVRQLLANLREAAGALPAGAAPWVIAIDDATEMPHLATSGLLSLDAVIPLVAVNRVDHETASWAYEFRKGLWLVLPARTQAETQLLVSLCKSDEAGKLKTGAALLVEDGAVRRVARIDKFR